MEIIEIIKQSACDTLNKHYNFNGEQQYMTKQCEYIDLCLNDIIYNGRFTGLTSTNNARANVQSVGIPAIMVELIRGAYLTYTIETHKGYARELNEYGHNGYPETEDQAVNHVYNQLHRVESPSIIYSQLLQNSDLTKLLIKNYANLATYSTKEERDYAYAVCPEVLNDKMSTLENLQSYLISSNSEMQR